MTSRLFEDSRRALRDVCSFSSHVDKRRLTHPLISMVIMSPTRLNFYQLDVEVTEGKGEKSSENQLARFQFTICSGLITEHCQVLWTQK